MARTARVGNQVQVVEDATMERLVAKGVSKVASIVSPWIVGVLTFGMGAALHFVLGGSAAWLAWSSLLVFVGVLVLTGVTYGQSHARGHWGRTHTTLTTFLAGMWVVATVIAGPADPLIWRLGVVGGMTMALSWNIRTVIRIVGWDQGGRIDPLGMLFGHGAEAAGLSGVQAHTTKTGPHKVEGVVQGVQGKHIAEDLQKKAPYIESGIPLPPGSITTSVDPDDASKARVTISDPRVLKGPIPWRGPSRVGVSIAEPLGPGLWQDLDPVEYVITNHHLKIMGMSGSGKSFGIAYSLLGEILTRSDVAVLAADITKRLQTLGPLRPALHRLETTKGGVRALVDGLQALVPQRTDYLAAKGLEKWEPGCGLTYLVAWFEEFPDIGDAIDMDAFVSFLKACRSAGVTVVISLQRSDWTQAPTIVSGQMASLCCGVNSPKDAKFGLSEAQQDAGARPELWGTREPGKAYLDAPTISEDRIVMPWRSYAWTVEQMAAHAAAYPASARPVDELSAAVCQASALPAGEDSDDEQEEGSAVEEYVKTADPSPDITAEADDPIEALDTTRFPPRKGPKMPTEQARGMLLDQLRAWVSEGRKEFATRDLARVKAATGYTSRGWLNDQLTLLVDDGVIERDDARQSYRIVRADALSPELTRA